MPFREDGIEVYFPKNQDNEFLEVVLYPKYFKLHPPSYSNRSRDELKREIIPFFVSGNGSLPKKHNFVCEIVDVNDIQRVVEIDYMTYFIIIMIFNKLSHAAIMILILSIND